MCVKEKFSYKLYMNKRWENTLICYKKSFDEVCRLVKKLAAYKWDKK